MKCYESRPGIHCHTEKCPMKQIISGKEVVTLDSIKTDSMGNERHYIVTARPFFNANEELEGIVESFLDITERKKANKAKEELEYKLIQSQKMEAIGTLAGGIAHDFNNILSAIFGYAELGKLRTSKDDPLRPYFEQICTAGDRAKDLVKHILTFSRQTEQNKGPVQVHSILKEVLKLIRASTPATIEIREDIDVQSDYIFADPTQIYQIIMNLCTNAVHAMEKKGGVLDVSLHVVSLGQVDLEKEPGMNPGEYTDLIIRDTGHGITNETKEKIFDPYFTTKEVDKGTGLGLSVVLGIVKSHGGKISVESVVNSGSTFQVFLPIVDPEVDSGKNLEEKLPSGNESILLVDDEETVATVEKQVLESLGYTVTVKTSSIEAYEAFKKHPQKFDLVITDQTMPNMTGVDLAKELLLLKPNIPIILCTGFSKSVDKIIAKAIGIKGFAMKPIAIEEIAKLTRKVLDG